MDFSNVSEAPINRIGLKPTVGKSYKLSDNSNTESQSLAKKLVYLIESNVYLDQKAKVAYLLSSKSDRKDDIGCESTIKESIMRAAVVKREYERLLRRSWISWKFTFGRKSKQMKTDLENLISVYEQHKDEIEDIHSSWIRAYRSATCSVSGPFVKYNIFEIYVNRYPDLKSVPVHNLFSVDSLVSRKPFAKDRELKIAAQSKQKLYRHTLGVYK